jgi:glycosyltransferase involved in cell wall biosynthesis
VAPEDLYSRKTPTEIPATRQRLLVFIVAYNAEKTIAPVIRRIPTSLLATYDVDVLIIDDASGDQTFEKSYEAGKQDLPFTVRTMFNPVNQGYGGNQRLGYHYAIQNGYDFVALVHGDGQYAPECLPDLLEPLRKGEAAAVFGSRMLTPKGALRGGMPLYKFVGNRILTWIENRLLNTHLSEFHSGYRIYSTRALVDIPFDRNSNGFHFDTEIIIQLVIAGHRIAELPIPTYYGDEISRVNGIAYAGQVVLAALKASLQRKGIFYDRKFDCAPPDTRWYVPKFNYRSPHSLALERIAKGAHVLDVGCAGGYMAAPLKNEKGCVVDGIDGFSADDVCLANFYLHDLNHGLPPLDYTRYDYVLMLDVIEHLTRPEAFLEEFRRALKMNPGVEIIMSTANIGFIILRLMLLAGQFNYGKRGILDMSHTRLFTFASFRRAISQAGFEILEVVGVPAPFPLALGDNPLSRFLIKANQALIWLFRGLFSYQIFVRVKPQPSLEYLLQTATEKSAQRAKELEAVAANSGLERQES